MENKTPERKVDRLTRNLFEAVDYLHCKGILHRDIKPANILLRTNKGMTWALGDFGLAIDLKNEDIDNSLIVGTKEYLPPEVQQEYQSHPKTVDIWSSAIVIFEVLTGKRPF